MLLLSFLWLLCLPRLLPGHLNAFFGAKSAIFIKMAKKRPRLVFWVLQNFYGPKSSTDLKNYSIIKRTHAFNFLWNKNITKKSLLLSFTSLFQLLLVKNTHFYWVFKPLRSRNYGSYVHEPKTAKKGTVRVYVNDSWSHFSGHFAHFSSIRGTFFCPIIKWEWKISQNVWF